MSYSSEVLADSPLAYYRLGETSITATASSNFGPEPPSNAIDGSATTFWTTAGTPTGWLRLQMASATVFAEYRIARRHDIPTRNPTEWTFEGSNDGTSWTVLDTQTGITWPTVYEVKAFSFANATAYFYYRLNITANGGDTYLSVSELNLGSMANVMADSSGNGRDGAYAVAATLGAASLIAADPGNTSIDIAVSGAAPSVPSAMWMNGSTMSIEAWIQPDVVNGTADIAARAVASGTPQWQLQVDSTKARLTVHGGGNTFATGSTTLVIGQTYHIVGTYDGTTARIYVNGILEGSEVGPMSANSDQTLAIGRDSNGGQGFDGRIDEMAYYSTALSSARIAAHYAAAITAPGPDVADVSLTGVLSTVAAAFAMDTEGDAALAGVLGGVVGNFALDAAGAPHDVSFAGVLPSVAVAFALNVVGAPANVALAGSLPGPVSTLALVGGARLALVGSLPTAIGYFELDLGIADTSPGDLALVGQLPNPELEVFVYWAAPVTMLLRILDDTLPQAPTSLTVSLSGAIPESVVEFTINGGPVTLVNSDYSGTVSAVSLPVPPLPAGTYSVNARSANAQIVRNADAQFTLVASPAVPFVPNTDAAPGDVPDAVNEDGSRNWVFQDLLPGGLGSWVLPRNPMGATHPVANRALTPFHSTTIDGKHHIFESGTAAHEWTLTGLLFTQAEQITLESFGNINRRIYIIDDLARAWMTALTKVEVTPRLRTRFHLVGEADQVSDWVAEYTVTATVYQTPQ